MEFFIQHICYISSSSSSPYSFSATSFSSSSLTREACVNVNKYVDLGFSCVQKSTLFLLFRGSNNVILLFIKKIFCKTRNQQLVRSQNVINFYSFIILFLIILQACYLAMPLKDRHFKVAKIMFNRKNITVFVYA